MGLFTTCYKIKTLALEVLEGSITCILEGNLMAFSHFSWCWSPTAGMDHPFWAPPCVVHTPAFKSSQVSAANMPSTRNWARLGYAFACKVSFNALSTSSWSWIEAIPFMIRIWASAGVRWNSTHFYIDSILNKLVIQRWSKVANRRSPALQFALNP